MEIGKKERAPKNKREQGEQGKMLKGAGSIDPPNRASMIITWNRNWMIEFFFRLIPLGVGRRVCPGDPIGTNRLLLILTMIVQHLDLHPAPGKDKPNHDLRRGFTGGIFGMPYDYEITIQLRDQ